MAEPDTDTRDGNTEPVVDASKAEDADQLYADVEAGAELTGDVEESSSGSEEESEEEVTFLLDKGSTPVERQASRQTKTYVRTGDGEEKERVVESKAFSLPEPNEDTFEIDIDGLAEKPWRKPGADITDYFNYGFVESTWRGYCQKQIKMRMASQMKNTIQVLDTDSNTSVPPPQDRFPKPQAHGQPPSHPLPPHSNVNNPSNNNRRHGSAGPRNTPPQFSPRGGPQQQFGRQGNRFPRNGPPFMPPNFGRGMPPPPHFMHGPRGPMPGNFNPNFAPGPPNMGFGGFPPAQSSEFEVPLNSNPNNNNAPQDHGRGQSGRDQQRSRSGSRVPHDRRERGRKRSRSPTRRSSERSHRESSRSRSDHHRSRDDRERRSSRDRERRSSRSRERKKRR